MSRLWIELAAGGRARFAPGETITGEAGWERARAPERAELRLFWFTAGIGTRDVTLVEVRDLGRPREADRHGFAFALPGAPYTFSGSLISVRWAIELVLLPEEETTIFDFALSPFEEEIVLRKLEDPGKKGFRIRAGA